MSVTVPCESMVVSSARVQSLGEPGWFENEFDESMCAVAVIDGVKVAECPLCGSWVEVEEQEDGSLVFPDHHTEG